MCIFAVILVFVALGFWLSATGLSYSATSYPISEMEGYNGSALQEFLSQNHLPLLVLNISQYNLQLEQFVVHNSLALFVCGAHDNLDYLEGDMY